MKNNLQGSHPVRGLSFSLLKKKKRKEIEQNTKISLSVYLSLSFP